MTDHQDDFDVADDFGQEEQVSSASGISKIVEIVKSSFLAKVGLLIVGGAGIASAFVAITSPDPIEETKSIVRAGDTSSVQVAPGTETLDKKYLEAVQQGNQQRADAAATTGASALPTPIAPVKSGIDIPQPAPEEGGDPLKEWKQNIAARKVKSEQAVEEEIAQPPAPPLPDVVPLVQPVRPRVELKADPQASTALANQARTIIAAQAPGKARMVSITSMPSAYEEMKKSQTASKTPSASAQAQSASSSQAAMPPPGAEKVIVPAGQIAYAQLLTELNSDVPSPALATVLSGPFAGARIIGAISTMDDYIVINFSKIMKDDVGYAVSAVALDERTTLPAQRTSIDHHYLERIILPAAASFVSGYGSALAETGTTTTTTAGGGVVSNKPKPSAKESLYKGLEESTSTLSSVIEEGASKEPTIRIARGTTMGILFLETVKTSSIEQ